MSAIPHLVVPIHIEAAWIDPSLTPIVGSNADFSALPHVRTTKDAAGSLQREAVNIDRPFLSSTIEREPFAEQSANFRSGLHLHWSLPDTLTRSLPTEGEAGRVLMPPAPNRWLICRELDKNNGKDRKQWLIESDWLHPVENMEESGAVYYPVLINLSDPEDGAKKSQSQSLHSNAQADIPFRAMGRALPLNASGNGWVPTEPHPESLPALTGEKLTALGWGDPAFAAFYPNCHSVFGFFDEDLQKDLESFASVDPGKVGTRVTYTLLGWHSANEDDPMQTVLPAMVGLVKDAAAVRLGKDATDGCIRRMALEEKMGWGLAQDQEPGAALETLYLSELTIASEDLKPASVAGADCTSVVLASTTEDALIDSVADSHQDLADWLTIVNAGLDLDHTDDELDFRIDERRKVQRFAVAHRDRQLPQTKGDAPVGSGGRVWDIIADPPKSSSTGKPSTATPSRRDPLQWDSIPMSVAAGVEELNRMQRETDSAELAVQRQREDLYALWCCYQMRAYPNPDTIGEPPLLGDLILELQNVAVPALKAALTDLAARKGSLAKTAAHYAGMVPPGFRLADRPAGRFWRPRDPVLLFGGGDLQPHPGHGRDGVLDCAMAAISPPRLGSPLGTLNSMRDLLISSNEYSKFQASWSRKSHAMYMEWEAQLLELGDPASGLGADYLADSLTDHYALGANVSMPDELTLRSSDPRALPVSGAVTITGRSLLSPHGAELLIDRIAAYLVHHSDAKDLLDLDGLREKVAENTPTVPGQDHVARTRALWTQRLKLGLDNGRPLHELQRLGVMLTCLDGTYAGVDATSQLRRTLQTLALDELHWQSQAMTGFYTGLLGQRAAFQLPIADPFGFPEQQQLAEELADLIGGSARSHPELGAPFLPLGSGQLNITRLRLIDSFGRFTKLVDTSDTNRQMSVTGTEPLTESGHPWLPPRLAQPARLTFRLRAAAAPDCEANAHPAASPICGWLVPNPIDRTLTLHDALGGILGVLIDAEIGPQWQPAPGDHPAERPGHFTEPILQMIVDWVFAQKTGAVEAFVDVLEAALSSIHPQDGGQSEGVLPLFGHPLALVHATVGLEMQGPLVSDTAMSAWAERIAKPDNPRRDRAVESVKIPTVLGQWHKSGDMLAGFWSMLPQEKLSPAFSASVPPETVLPENSNVSQPALTLTPNGPPQDILLLMDPRGPVHLNCGLLPAKAIHIPPHHYTHTLARMQTLFRLAPVLMPAGAAEMILPHVNQAQWAWIEAQPDGTWNYFANPPAPAFSPHFAPTLRLAEGWLRLTPDPSV
jgi:hypothetical protein